MRMSELILAEPSRFRRGDAHVHSSTCDDASATIGQQITAAESLGLTWLCLTTHVRADSDVDRVARFVDDVRAASRTTELEVFVSVEAKILNITGALDLPPDLDLTALDTVHIADHQFPLDRPVSPSDMRNRLASGAVAPAAAAAAFVEACSAALGTCPGSVLAHPGSILSKIGIGDGLGPAHIADLGEAAFAAGALVEQNLKWQPAPSGLLSGMRTAGVGVVVASDSHHDGDLAARWTEYDAGDPQVTSRSDTPP